MLRHFFSEAIVRSIISSSNLLYYSINSAVDRPAMFSFIKLTLENVCCLAVNGISILQYATMVYSWLHWRFCTAVLVTVGVSMPRIEVDEK